MSCLAAARKTRPCPRAEPARFSQSCPSPTPRRPGPFPPPTSPSPRAARHSRHRGRRPSSAPAEPRSKGESRKQERGTARFFSYRLHEPSHRFRGDLGRDHVRPIELPVGHLVAFALQLRHNAAAAFIDGQDLILSPVRNEDRRFACPLPRYDDAGENPSTDVNKSPLARPIDSA